MARYIVSYRISQYWGHIVAYLYCDNYPSNKVNILHNFNQECCCHHVALNAIGNINKGSLVLDAFLYNRPSMTSTHLYPDGRPRRPISLPTPPVKSETDLSREHSVSRRECGGRKGDSSVQMWNNDGIVSSRGKVNDELLATCGGRLFCLHVHLSTTRFDCCIRPHSSPVRSSNQLSPWPQKR